MKAGVEYFSEGGVHHSGGSQSPETLPTTMSRTMLNRVPFDISQKLQQQTLAMRRKRVQSAVNRKSKNVPDALVRNFAGIS